MYKKKGGHSSLKEIDLAEDAEEKGEGWGGGTKWGYEKRRWSAKRHWKRDSNRFEAKVRGGGSEVSRRICARESLLSLRKQKAFFPLVLWCGIFAGRFTRFQQSILTDYLFRGLVNRTVLWEAREALFLLPPPHFFFFFQRSSVCEAERKRGGNVDRSHFWIWIFCFYFFPF